MFDLIGDVLVATPAVAKTHAFFKISWRLFFWVIRFFDPTEALVNEIQKDSLRQIGEFAHRLHNLHLSFKDTFQAGDELD